MIMWHPNLSAFDPVKTAYFNEHDPEAGGFSGFPEYASHMPRSVTYVWVLREDGRRLARLCSDPKDAFTDTADNTAMDLNGVANDVLKARRVSPLATRDLCRSLHNVTALKTGPCPYRHTLLAGDTIIVHPGSGFALMPDGKRWIRDDTEWSVTNVRKRGTVTSGNGPLIGMFLGYMEYNDDGFVLTNYEMLIDLEDESKIAFKIFAPSFGKKRKPGRRERQRNARDFWQERRRVRAVVSRGVKQQRVCFMPFDVVKNVRFDLQRRSAMIIQRVWRSYQSRKLYNACVTIQRAWLARYYECTDKRKGSGYVKCHAAFFAKINI